MLDLYRDRLEYSEMLKPPTDYELDCAIATTYSLDFDALIGSYLSLCKGYDNDAENHDSKTIMQFISIIDDIKDKVIIFCENGRIKKPNNSINKDIHINLEDSISYINMNNEGVFHPKMWLIKFINKNTKNYLYRLVVLSRNITFDNSWDIAISFDGIEHNSQNNNQPLIDFIKVLKEKGQIKNKNIIIDKMIEELSTIKFDYQKSKLTFNEKQLTVSNMEILPYGIGNNNLLKTKHDSKVFIMSPFITKDIVDYFNNTLNSNNNYFITRMDALNEINDLINNDSSKFKYYVLNNRLLKFDEENNSFQNEIYKHDIHAKIYIVENSKEVNIYLGSLNATHSAWYKNMELMIKLTIRKDTTENFIDTFWESLNNPKGKKNQSDEEKVFKEATENDLDSNYFDKKKEEQSIKNIMKRVINYLNVEKWELKELNKNKCDLTICFKNSNDIPDFLIKPYMCTNEYYKKVEKNKITYEKITKTQISKLFIIKVEKQEFCVILDINLPKELTTYRYNEFLEKYINVDNALECILYILDKTGVMISTNRQNNNKNPQDNYNNYLAIKNQLFELLLECSYENPKKIERVIEILKLDKIANKDELKEIKKLIEIFKGGE